MKHSFARTAGILAAVVALAGCDPVSLTALGIGGTAAVNHKMSGTPYRTFTAPLVKVRLASLSALKRMGIRKSNVERTESGELITAQAGTRNIEVELETITANTTRMKVVAHDGSLLYDGSTASEIIVQTGKALGV